MINELLKRFATCPDESALIFGGEAVTFGELINATQMWQAKLKDSNVPAGAVIMLKGDFSKDSISALLALLTHNAITVLLSPTSYEKQDEFTEIGQVGWILETETGAISNLDRVASHPLYGELRECNAPGIVLFSSGTTGVSKGTVHHASRLMEKFRVKGKKLSSLAFLLFDHIAGLDTLFYNLSNLSTLVIPDNRTPRHVCELIETHKVEVLPTAPSFLNLLMLSGAYKEFDLSSLKIITYGSEMMPLSTLERCDAAFPNTRIIQKYGTSEIGALPTRSKSNTSTFLKVGGHDGFDWRVRDGLLEIRAMTAMLGYLNAPSPFTSDGYFMTGDRVEVDGEYIRFLGRDSNIINVGGQKVFPAEVENLIQNMPEVAEVAVFGEPHAILGSVVVARIRPTDTEMPMMKLRQLVRQSLSGQIEPYKIPQKFLLTAESLTSSRFKQVRKAG